MPVSQSTYGIRNKQVFGIDIVSEHSIGQFGV
jgi:hypothetical protein